MILPLSPHITHTLCSYSKHNLFFFSNLHTVLGFKNNVNMNKE